jgi:hypothetical protein
MASAAKQGNRRGGGEATAKEAAGEATAAAAAVALSLEEYQASTLEALGELESSIAGNVGAAIEKALPGVIQAALEAAAKPRTPVPHVEQPVAHQQEEVDEDAHSHHSHRSLRSQRSSQRGDEDLGDGRRQQRKGGPPDGGPPGGGGAPPGGGLGLPDDRELDSVPWSREFKLPFRLVESQQFDDGVPLTNYEFEECIPGFGKLREAEQYELIYHYLPTARIADLLKAVDARQVLMDRCAVKLLKAQYRFLELRVSYLEQQALVAGGYTTETRGYWAGHAADLLQEARRTDVRGELGEVHAVTRDAVVKARAKARANSEVRGSSGGADAGGKK